MMSFLCTLSAALAFQPAVMPQQHAAARATTSAISMAEEPLITRRATVLGVAGAAAAAFGAMPAFAEVATDSYKLLKDYPTDAKNMLVNMKAATELARGNAAHPHPAPLRPPSCSPLAQPVHGPDPPRGPFTSRS